MRRPHHLLPLIRLRYVLLALVLAGLAAFVADTLGYHPPPVEQKPPRQR